MHRPIVGRIERGVHELSIEGLYRIAAALEVDPRDIAIVIEPEWREAAGWTAGAWREVPWPPAGSAAWRTMRKEKAR